jgi:glucosamine 6-phosphate synthetase-like amidotransferase/phosphosugar isomerase protein
MGIMCGLFGYFGKTAISSSAVMDILADMEKAQLPIEKTPVGGDGAGIALLKDPVQCIKFGFRDESPVKLLRSAIPEQKISQVLGHVRKASPDFKETVGNPECTQPYSLTCPGSHKLVSMHNGMFSNYENIYGSLKKEHNFESKSFMIIDSEVIPHYFEELLEAHRHVEAAVTALYDTFEGPGNALAMWLRKKDNEYLILLYKGKARGLYVWESPDGDILFTSRREPVEDHLGWLIKEQAFSLRQMIEPRVEAYYKKIVTLCKAS